MEDLPGARFFQCMGGPVAKVQWTGRPPLKWIACRNMLQVQPGTPDNHLLHGLLLEGGQIAFFPDKKRKKSLSFITATFTASAMPDRHCLLERVRRKSKSLTTAKGGAKVPTQFFLPKEL